MFDIPVVNEEPKKGSRRSGIMLCYPFEEKRLATWVAPYIIQPKLDGVRCRALIQNNQCILVSSENHIIESVAHINKALVERFPNSTIELDGELYCHGMDFQSIISRTSRSKNIHKESEKIEYHIFDVIVQGTQVYRSEILNKMLDNDYIKVVHSELVKDIGEIMKFYSRVVDEGYEGFVIRDAHSEYTRKRSTSIMKFKPHQKDNYTIVGMQEEVSILGYPKGTLGAFICTSNEGTLFNVGTGLTAGQREEYWKIRDELVGKKLKVKYQALTAGNKIPRFPVALEVIK